MSLNGDISCLCQLFRLLCFHAVLLLLLSLLLCNFCFSYICLFTMVRKQVNKIDIVSIFFNVVEILIKQIEPSVRRRGRHQERPAARWHMFWSETVMGCPTVIL